MQPERQPEQIQLSLGIRMNPRFARSRVVDHQPMPLRAKNLALGFTILQTHRPLASDRFAVPHIEQVLISVQAMPHPRTPVPVMRLISAIQ
jgi:hypothetical protein